MMYEEGINTMNPGETSQTACRQIMQERGGNANVLEHSDSAREQRQRDIKRRVVSHSKGDRGDVARTCSEDIAKESKSEPNDNGAVTGAKYAQEMWGCEFIWESIVYIMHADDDQPARLDSRLGVVGEMCERDSVLPSAYCSGIMECVAEMPKGENMLLLPGATLYPWLTRGNVPFGLVNPGNAKEGGGETKRGGGGEVV